MTASTTIERFRNHDPEAGTGLIGTAAGVAVFLVLLLFSVQLAVNLYATSTVTAAGYDSARVVASSDVDHSDPAGVFAARARAEARFHHMLGAAADGATFTWDLTGDAVRLRVRMDPPGILPSSLGSRIGFDHIDRTFVARIEELR